LFLGRICPEKGVHVALDAVKLAGVPLFIAGEVFPYEAHQRYFADEVRPRLDRHRRFLGPVGFVRKRRLLTAASCLLVPSLAPETSSLVAREAIACGTPVIAFPNGALSEPWSTAARAFSSMTSPAMADAIRRAGEIDSGVCRRTARHRFGKDKMVAAYLGLYARLAHAASPCTGRHEGSPHRGSRAWKRLAPNGGTCGSAAPPRPRSSRLPGSCHGGRRSPRPALRRRGS
jgi:glycosyltransferase involved in cell wall biosynthesis